MKIKAIIFFGLLFFLFGCKKEKIRFVQKTYPEDSLISEGYMIDTLPIKYWKSFDLQRRLVAISEFKIINNEAYLNQEIVFDKHGDTLFDRSNFFTCKSSIINKDSVLLEIKYEGMVDAIYDDANSYPMLVYHNNINANFSNINKLKLDTLIFHNNKLQIRLPKNKRLRGVINEVLFLEEGGMQIREVYFDYGKDYQDISEIR